MNRFSDANWFSLEQSAKDGNVIPIVGPDALIVEYEGQTVPFYRLVTEDLLRNLQIEPDPEILQHTWSLHRAVSAILANKGGQGAEQRIRREIIRLVDKYSKKAQPAESLRLLASIPAFTLYVSLIPDNLLERAMMASDLFWLSVPSPFGRVMPPNHSLTCRYLDRANAAYSRCRVPAPALAVVLPCTKKKL